MNSSKINSSTQSWDDNLPLEVVNNNVFKMRSFFHMTYLLEYLWSGTYYVSFLFTQGFSHKPQCFFLGQWSSKILLNILKILICFILKKEFILK